MSTRRLLLVSGIALIVAMVMLVPLRLGLRLVDLDRLGLRAADASGSLWTGRLRAAQWHGRALGDIDVRLSPLPLLAGTRRVSLHGGDLRLSLQQGRRHGIADARGSFILDRIDSAPGVALTLRSDGATLLFDGSGCAMAQGHVELALRRAGSDTALATLAGDLACNTGAATVALSSQAAAAPPFDGLRVDLRIESDGAWRAQSLLPPPAGDAARLVLEATGFQPGPAGWSRVDTGRFE